MARYRKNWENWKISSVWTCTTTISQARFPRRWVSWSRSSFSVSTTTNSAGAFLTSWPDSRTWKLWISPATTSAVLSRPRARLPDSLPRVSKIIHHSTVPSFWEPPTTRLATDASFPLCSLHLTSWYLCERLEPLAMNAAFLVRANTVIGWLSTTWDRSFLPD